MICSSATRLAKNDSGGAIFTGKMANLTSGLSDFRICDRPFGTVLSFSSWEARDWMPEFRAEWPSSIHRHRVMVEQDCADQVSARKVGDDERVATVEVESL